MNNKKIFEKETTGSLMKQRFGSWAGDPSRNVLWDLHRPENKSISTNTGLQPSQTMVEVVAT